jgi:hypothetical protein
MMADDEVERTIEEAKRRHETGVIPIELRITEAELRNNSETALFELIAHRLNIAQKQIRERDAKDGK